MATAISLLALSLLLAEPAPPASAPPAAPTIPVDQLTKVTIEPAVIQLDDPRSRQRVLATGYIGDRAIDLTDAVRWEIADTTLAILDDRFELAPTADGATHLQATIGKHQVQVPLTVKNYTNPRPMNFTNEVVPVFTKLTCNSGGCHGKSGGQNGFKLSLLGFEPTEDYAWLLKEAAGRRIFPAAPEHSLLLRKATGIVPHGGGTLMQVGDDNYELLVAWMRQGMPYGSDSDPVVTSIAVYPGERRMLSGWTQRLRVEATYTDGRTEDVTRFTQFQSNDESVGSVDEHGKVSAMDMSGEAAIMVRAMGKVTVFRATVPVEAKYDRPQPFVAKNFVDERATDRWNKLGLVPSPTSDDYTFLRRVTLDLCGRLPRPDEVAAFADSKDADKRAKLIDRLLDEPDYAAYMAMKWGALLQNRRGGNAENQTGTHALWLWLRDAFARDMPYDQFVRAVLTSKGTPEYNPPVMWFRNVRTPEDQVDAVAQLFLGTRIQCARCHHHPFEKWSQDDYYGMASFFTRIGRKTLFTDDSNRKHEAVFVKHNGEATNPKTGKAMPAKGLDAAAEPLDPGADPREGLADWMAEPENPFFATAMVNRTWGHFFGRGLIEPVDDIRVTNPPVNPELLDALARDFIKSGYSVKHLMRTICNSATYQLSAEPNPTNAKDQQNFSRFYPRRLPAEVLSDAIDTALSVPTGYNLPAGYRAIDLPDEATRSYFLDIFGRPARASSCECERSGEANLSQALHLLNSNDIQGKLTNGDGRAMTLAKDARPIEERVRELFLVFFARPPQADEAQRAKEYIDSKENKAEAFQNLAWALVNTKEFQFTK